MTWTRTSYPAFNGIEPIWTPFLRGRDLGELNGGLDVGVSRLASAHQHAKSYDQELLFPCKTPRNT